MKKTIIVLLVSLPLIAAAQNRGAAMMNAGNATALAKQGQGPNGNGTGAAIRAADGTCAGANVLQRNGPGNGTGAGRGSYCAGPNAMGARGGGRGPMNFTCGANCPLGIPAGTVTTLTPAQVVAALDEEHVAHDLYAVAAAKWNLRVFTQISSAEVRHAEALTQLATSSAITVPAAVAGSYSTADLQNLYTAVLPLIGESETAALGAGAFVEETDIADLRRLLTTDCDDVTRNLLANLESASRYHLVAFVRNLAARGVTYQPKVLSAEAYAEIVGS